MSNPLFESMDGTRNAKQPLDEVKLKSTTSDPHDGRVTVGVFHFILTHRLTQEDKETSAQDQNIYRLAHWLGAAQKLERATASLKDKDDPASLRRYVEVMKTVFSFDHGRWGLKACADVEVQIVSWLSLSPEARKASQGPTFAGPWKSLRPVGEVKEAEGVEKKDKQKYYSGYEVGQLDKDRGRAKTASLTMTATNSEWKRGYEDGYSGKACEVKSPLEFLESLMTEGSTPDKLRAWANELSNHIVAIRDADVGRERKTWARDLWRLLARECDIAGCGGSVYTSAYTTLSFLTTRMLDRELDSGDKKNLFHAINDMVDYLKTWGKKTESVQEAALPIEGNEEKMMSFFRMMGFEDLGTRFVSNTAERGVIAFVMGYIANQRLGPEKGVKMMDLLRRFTDKPGPDPEAATKGIAMIRDLKAKGRVKESKYSKGDVVNARGETWRVVDPSDDEAKKVWAVKTKNPDDDAVLSFGEIKEATSPLYMGKPTVEPKVGMRVAAIDGPGQSAQYADRTGVVTKKLSVTGHLASILPDDGWEVKMDDGSTDTIHGRLNTDPSGHQGIGWYVLKESSYTQEEAEAKALEYFKEEGWHTYSSADELEKNLGINYGMAKTVIRSLLAKKLIVRHYQGYDSYAINESSGDRDAELRAKYAERQKLSAKHDWTPDDTRRAAQLDRQIADLRRLLARQESKEDPIPGSEVKEDVARDDDGKFSSTGSTAKKKPYQSPYSQLTPAQKAKFNAKFPGPSVKKKPYKSPYSQLSQAQKDKFDAKFPGPGVKEDKENPIPGEDVPSNYNEWPHVGWWKTRERIAKGMTVSELHYARLDCDKAARANPATESKYRDEGSIYAMELRRRGSK